MFNIVADAIVRYWLTLVLDDGSEVNGLGWSVQDYPALFHADDGLTGLVRWVVRPVRNHERD